MIKILLAEDDETIRFGIRAALGRKGYEVTCCSDTAACKSLFSGEYSLILLDLNLPDGSGYDLCRWVKHRADTPIIFLTVRDDVEDITRGLDMGADDYITKPFHIAVLESRISAVLRRARRKREPETDISCPADGSLLEEGGLKENRDWAEGIQTGGGEGEDGVQILSCGGIRMDKRKMQVFAGEEEISLTSLEYRLLQMFLENKGCILTRKGLLDKLWDAGGNFVNDNTLTVAVKRLREKLHNSSCITTVRGIGYRMEEKK